MPLTSGFFERLILEQEFRDYLSQWFDNPNAVASEQMLPVGSSETGDLSFDLAQSLNSYSLKCNFFPKGSKRLITDKTLTDSFRATMSAFQSLHKSEDSLGLRKKTIELWTQEVNQFIAENSIDAIYRDSKLSESEKKLRIKKLSKKYKGYIQNEFMPRIYDALRLEYQDKTQRELSKMMAEEEALNLSFRYGILNVRPGEDCMEFTADLPFAFSRATPKSKGVDPAQQEVFTFSAMLQHLGLANLSLHCAGYITRDGKVIVESETIRSASPYPLEGKSLYEQQRQLYTNLCALFKKLALMRLKALKEDDKTGNEEKNPITIKLDVIPLLSMMQNWMADLDADKQNDISTYVIHMLLQMQLSTYTISEGKRKKYFKFEPKIFPVGINNARLIPGGAQERFLTWSFNGMYDDLNVFFAQNKFNVPKLESFKLKLSEMMDIDATDPKIKSLLEKRQLSWEALQLKYNQVLPQETKALRIHFMELDLLWKKHHKNEYALLELRQRKFLACKDSLHASLEKLRVEIYGEFVRNDPAVYPNEKQFYNVLQAMLMTFELISQEQFGLKIFRLQSGILPALLWYLSQQQAHATHEFCLRGLDRTGVVLMLEKILEESTRNSGMFQLSDFGKVLSALPQEQFVNTSYDVSALNRGTPGNKTDGGFELDPGLKVSAKLLRMRYPDLKPSLGERLASHMYHTKIERDYLAETAWKSIDGINLLWQLPNSLFHTSLSFMASAFIVIARRLSKDFARVISNEEMREQQELGIKTSAAVDFSKPVSYDDEIAFRMTQAARRQQNAHPHHRARSRSASRRGSTLDLRALIDDRSSDAEPLRAWQSYKAEEARRSSTYSYSAASRFYRSDPGVINLNNDNVLPAEFQGVLASDARPTRSFPPGPNAIPW